MFNSRVFLGLFAILLLIPLASNSEATLWDLQVQVNVENSPIISGERPIVSGVVTDHASKPVYKATVNVKSQSMSIITTTSQNGEFSVELGKHERIPGNYIVTVSVSTLDGRTGITTTQFQVKGELEPTTVTNSKLSTPEAQKYLNSSPEDFEKNPIGFMLYNYYQKLYKEYLEEQQISNQISQEQLYLKEQQDIAKELRDEAIEEYNPKAGVFSGPQYENYVNNLDDEVKDVVVDHLEFTKNLFYEAQQIRNEIIENGGSPQEAHQAYLEKLSTSREMIENYEKNSGNSTNVEQIPVKIEPVESENQTTEEDVESESNSTILVNVDGVVVEVNYDDDIFVVEVNGKVLQFLLQDGKLIQINSD